MYHRSIAPFLREVTKVWWATIPCALGTVVGFVQWFIDGKFPRWVAWTLAVAGFLLAAFVAYHRERTKRLSVEATLRDFRERTKLDATNRVGRIRHVCIRIEELGKAGVAKHNHFAEMAVLVGKEVVAAVELGAYSHDSVLEGRLRGAVDGNLFPQWNKNMRNLDGTPINNVNATQPTYLVFWEARAAAAQFFGVPVQCDTHNESATSGCFLIAKHLQSLWGLSAAGVG